MQISNYTKTNNILGWVVWLIASFTYVATVAPTTSFWDCGEYIATSVKLQVGHPPGAPLFQLVGNFFSQFAFGDLTQQAYMVNLLSAFSSSFTVLFLFWTITYVAKKLILRSGGEMDNNKTIAVFGAGLVGALAFTWSDSFWYSAVEGEVYAMSSFFTAVAFWAVTKWERAFEADAYANRWLILIAYLIGLSVGVHILVFLAIPPIVMVVYYKFKPDATMKDSVIGTVLSVIILGAVFKVIIPLLLKMFGFLEITFVNSLTLPKNSGTVFSIILIAAGAYFGIQWAKRKNWPFVSQGIFAILFILIGYSSFVTLGIRSNAGTPIDENNPEDALSMLAYYNREQYGDWPVMYGKTFNAKLDMNEPFVDGSPAYVYDEEQKKYVVSNEKRNTVPNYDSQWKVFFPRMWSDQANHVQGYKDIMGVSDDVKPTFGDNFKFFLNYQVGHMYWRYFLWNFVGRQNDFQHRYEPTNGNWLTGINGIDNGRLGDQSLLPDYMKNNPARNRYFAIPFLLGLLGLGYQAFKDGKDAWVIGMFFLFTGLAIVVYTNHKPFEPRERDYAFVGSFYVFAIWVGLGVVALYDLLKSRVKTPALAYGVSAIMLLAVPVNMVAQNWDDHDRSDRWMARDTARAYLDSCAPNAILFTNGDNDTFPLWYLQEVEEYRTDVRVVNLSLLNTDWYIDQLKRAAYEDGNQLPLTFEWDQYKMGTRDVIHFNPRKFRQDYGRGPGNRWTTQQFIDFVQQDGAQFQYQPYQLAQSPYFYYYPQKNLRIEIDKEQVLANGVVSEADSARILDYIDWDMKGNTMLKRDLMVIDLINQNDWSRPIYFSMTVGSSPSAFFYLQEYFRLEGLAYRFVPIKTEVPRGSIEYGYVDTDILFNNLMSWEFQNIADVDNYYDETCRRPVYNLRTIFARAAREMNAQDQTEKAVQLLDRAMELMPVEKFELNYFAQGIIQGYYLTGEFEKADDLVIQFADQLDQEIVYYESFGRNKQPRDQMGNALGLYRMINGLASQYHRDNPSSGPNPIRERYLPIKNRYGL